MNPKTPTNQRNQQVSSEKNAQPGSNEQHAKAGQQGPKDTATIDKRSSTTNQDRDRS